MILLWGDARAVEIPLETFRFDPDPWDFAHHRKHSPKCVCAECRRVRVLLGKAAVAGSQFETALAVSPESALGHCQVQIAAGPLPTPPAPAKPKIIAFDEGAVELERRRQEAHAEAQRRRAEKPSIEAAEPFDVPPWLMAIARLFAVPLAILHRLFVRGLLRPRLRVVHEEGQP